MAPAAQRGHALAPQRQDLSRLCTGGQLDGGLSVKRGHLKLGAERGERRGNVERGDQVVPLAHEALVFLDTDQHVEIAGPSSRFASVPATRQPDSLAI